MSMLVEEFVKEVQYYKTRKAKDGYLCDIYDGFIFQKLKFDYFSTEKEKELNLIFGFNTDGTCMNKKQYSGDWPFYVSVLNVEKKKRRKKKFNFLLTTLPSDYSDELFQSVLHLLSNDLQILFKEGIICNDYLIHGYLGPILCDLPARCSVLLQKQFNGYFSCCFCDVKGEISPHNKTKICFPILDSNGNPIPPSKLRTKLSIIQDIIDGKKGFEKFKGNFCQFFMLHYFSPCFFVGIDPMHMILLGIMRTLVKFLSNKSSVFYITPQQTKIIENSIQKIKLPPNWHRNMPTRLCNCKAIDYLLLLFYGIDCFEWISQEYYSMLSILRNISWLSFQDAISEGDIAQIRNFSLSFLVKFETNFGSSKMTHNTHLLKHLYRQVLLFGPCSSNSMFSYEGFNHDLIQSATSTTNYLKRITLHFNFELFMAPLLKKMCEREPKFKDLIETLFNIKKKPTPFTKIGNYYFSRTRLNCTNYVELEDGQRGKISFPVPFEGDCLIFENSEKVSTIISVSEVKLQLIKCYSLKKVENFLQHSKVFKPVCDISALL